MDWKRLKGLLRAIFRPKVYVKPKCPIDGMPLEEFPGSPVLMCLNGHKFGPGMKKVDLINDGDFHGDI